MGLPMSARVYLGLVVLAGAGSLAYWTWAWRGPLPADPGLTALLLVLAVAAVHFPLMLSPSYKVNVSMAVYFAALLLLGMPTALTLVGLSQLAGGLTLSLRAAPGRRLPGALSALFNAGQLVAATGLGGLVYYALLPHQAPAPLERPANLLAVPLASAAMYLVNSWAVSVMVALQRGQRPAELWRAGRRIDGPQFAGLFLTGLTTALLAVHYPWAPLLLALPTAIIYVSLRRSVQLVEQVRRQEREAALLAEASGLFNASLELPATFEAVVEFAGRQLGDACALYLVAPDQAELRVAAQYHASPAEGERRRALLEAAPPRRGEGAIGAVADGGPPVLVGDLRAERDRTPPDGEAAGLHSWLCVPLRHRAEVLGVLTLGTTSPSHTLDERDLALAEAVAERAATAFANARLHEDRRRGELVQGTIAALSREVGGTLEPGDVARRLAASLHRHFAYSIVEVYLVDRPRREVVLRGFHHARYRRPDDGSRRLPFGRGIVGSVAEHGKALLVPDMAAAPRPDASGTADALPTRATLAAPIPGAAGPLGVIDLESERPGAFDADDLQIVVTVAQQAAVALENALLHERLSALAADLGAVLDSIEQGILMTDRAGRIRFANRRLGELLGIEAGALVGRPALEVAHEAIAPGMRDPARFIARLAWLYEHAEAAATDEVPLTRPVARVLERYSAPMHDPAAGAIVGRIEVYSDVTEPRRLERAKDEFLATASHELKTPITTLGGYLELLQRRVERRDDPEAARLSRYAGAIKGELARLTRLAEDLVEVARIGAGRLTLRPDPVDLAVLVRETVERFERRPGLRARGHRLICQVFEPLPGHYDALRLGQVLNNLLDNALKYSPAGGDVVVEARRVGDEAVITVRDRGIGVPAGEHERVFLPFYRGDNASAGSPEGLGLGLHISRGIVEEHGGRIWVEPAPGGSVFRVALPLGDRSREAVLQAGAAPRQVAELSPPPGAWPATPLEAPAATPGD